MNTRGELSNWIPWKLSGTSCRWLYLGNKRITEPFFDDTILACRNFIENQQPYKVISDLEIMAEWAEDMNSMIPSAIIFHVSRCGSTLLSQLLGLCESNVVLSEVPFFDELIRLQYKNNLKVEFISKYLNAAIKCYGQKRNENEKNLFIKTDSWHLHFYTLLRNLFPAVPFIFLYRNPGEVILSHQKQRGMQAVPGMIEPGVFGFSKERIKETNLDAYTTSVLESYFAKMIEIVKADSNTLLFNYKQGMSSIINEIQNALQLDITGETERLLAERTRFHGKYPNQLFAEDYKNTTTQDFLMPALGMYEKLETIRLSKVSKA